MIKQTNDFFLTRIVAWLKEKKTMKKELGDNMRLSLKTVHVRLSLILWHKYYQKLYYNNILERSEFSAHKMSSVESFFRLSVSFFRFFMLFFLPRRLPFIFHPPHSQFSIFI